MLPARVLFLGGLHNQGPAPRSLLLLADCCLQPNPTAWRNVKYSLLNCRAGVGLEPYQAFTAEEYYTANFKRGETKPTSRSRIRRAFCHLPATRSSRNSYASQSCLISPLCLPSPSTWGKTFRWALIYRQEKDDSASLNMPSDICKIGFFCFVFLRSLPRFCTGKGLSFLAWQDFWRRQPAAPFRPLPRCCSFLLALREPGCQPAHGTEHLLVKDAEGAKTDVAHVNVHSKTRTGQFGFLPQLLLSRYFFFLSQMIKIMTKIHRKNDEVVKRVCSQLNSEAILWKALWWYIFSSLPGPSMLRGKNHLPAGSLAGKWNVDSSGNELIFHWMINCFEIVCQSINTFWRVFPWFWRC